MEQVENHYGKNNFYDLSGKINRRSSYRGYDFSWVYLLLFVFLLVFGFLTNPTRGTQEIGWTFLNDSLLATGKSEKIVVINEERALIYIKNDQWNEIEQEETAGSIFSSDTGPHFNMNIKPLEIFEKNLQNALNQFDIKDKLEILYEKRTEWSKLFSSILVIIGIAVFIWLIWPTILKQTR